MMSVGASVQVFQYALTVTPNEIFDASLVHEIFN